jgi:hypothetical protein
VSVEGPPLPCDVLRYAGEVNLYCPNDFLTVASRNEQGNLALNEVDTAIPATEIESVRLYLGSQDGTVDLRGMTYPDFPKLDYLQINGTSGEDVLILDDSSSDDWADGFASAAANEVLAPIVLANPDSEPELVLNLDPLNISNSTIFGAGVAGETQLIQARSVERAVIFPVSAPQNFDITVNNRVWPMSRSEVVPPPLFGMHTEFWGFEGEDPESLWLRVHGPWSGTLWVNQQVPGTIETTGLPNIIQILSGGTPPRPGSEGREDGDETFLIVNAHGRPYSISDDTVEIDGFPPIHFANFSYVDVQAGVSIEDTASPGGITLSAIHPNPTATAAAVTLTLERPAEIRVVMYDLLGRVAQVLYDGPAGGELVMPVDVSTLADGLYFVVATGAGGVVSRPLTVVR